MNISERIAMPFQGPAWYYNNDVQCEIYDIVA